MTRWLWIILSLLLLVTPALAVVKTQVNTDSAQTLSNKTLDSTNTLTTVAISNPVFSGTSSGTYTLGGTLTITAPILSGSVTGTYTLAGTPTITAPILSGSVTGTYTLAGTPTLSGTFAGTPTFSGVQTYDAANIHDLTSATALTVRANSAGTDALVVDTTNTKTIHGALAGTHCEVQTTQFACGASATLDVLLSREAAAIWQMGTDAAAAVAQLVKGADARSGTDTDTAGGATTYASGRGTGTGVGGNLDLQVAYPGTTGTAHNALGTVARILGANKQSSGTASANSLIALTPIVNQSGTAGYTGLKVDVTETATGSGTKNLLDLQVGTTSKFAVDNTGALTATGALVGAATTDIVQVYAAVTFCRSDIPSAQLLPERVAKSDWALSRTAAGAETYNIICHLPAPTRTTAGKGWKLASFRIVQQITVAALTSNTFNDLSTTTYVNNVANAVADYGGAITITMPTATQANPYLTAGTVGTAAFMNTADAQVTLDFTVVMQNTGVYRLYAISATWTEQD